MRKLIVSALSTYSKQIKWKNQGMQAKKSRKDMKKTRNLPVYHLFHIFERLTKPARSMDLPIIQCTPPTSWGKLYIVHRLASFLIKNQ